MVYLVFSRKTNDDKYYITMETLSPPPSPREEYAKINKQISPYYDPYPKVIDVGLIASNLELEYINDRFCIKYEDKYFRLNNADGTIMLSKTKPLYFIELNKCFITIIKNKPYKLCCNYPYPHLTLCDVNDETCLYEISSVL